MKDGLPDFQPGDELAAADLQAIVEYLRRTKVVVAPGGGLASVSGAGGITIRATGLGSGSSEVRWAVLTSAVTAFAAGTYGVGLADVESAAGSGPAVLGNYQVHNRIPEILPIDSLVVVAKADGKWMIVGRYCPPPP